MSDPDPQGAPACVVPLPDSPGQPDPVGPSAARVVPLPDHQGQPDPQGAPAAVPEVFRAGGPPACVVPQPSLLNTMD